MDMPKEFMENIFSEEELKRTQAQCEKILDTIARREYEGMRFNLAAISVGIGGLLAWHDEAREQRNES